MGGLERDLGRTSSPFLILLVAGDAGRKSATAAAMTITSWSPPRGMTAASMSAALATSITSMPGGAGRSTVVIRVTLAPRAWARSARA